VLPNDTAWRLYETTVLRLGRSGRLRVDLARPLDGDSRIALTSLGVGTRFAIITAHNPGGRTLAAPRNLWRHFRLRAVLAARGVRTVPAIGESPDGSHRERGVAVAMDGDDAIAIARGFGQLAIYWFDGERLWLYGALEPRPPESLPV
jgi:hypothetical protein